MTTDVQQRADEIQARRADEEKILRQAARERALESRRKADARRKALPALAYEPAADPEPGERYVAAPDTIIAFDPVAKREYIAAVRGQWVPRDRAERLGIGGEGVVLVPA
jgi:hypothetical protein